MQIGRDPSGIRPRKGMGQLPMRREQGKKNKRLKRERKPKGQGGQIVEFRPGPCFQPKGGER